MKVAIIGWGSLLWDRRNLPLKYDWHEDGPLLPLEFARLSNDGRVTLVLHSKATPQPTCWALSSSDDWRQARADLKKRERCPNLESIHVLLKPSDLHGRNVNSEAAASVSKWLTSRPNVDAAIWTGLSEGGNWHKRLGQQFSPDLAMSYLSSLSGEALGSAREYIVRTPRRVRTALRERIEREFGWAAEPSVVADPSADSCNRWREFDEYTRHYDDWYALLEGAEAELDGGVKGTIDVVYQASEDPTTPICRIRIRFPDGSSRTLEAALWSSFSEHLAFPSSVDLAEASLRSEKRLAEQRARLEQHERVSHEIGIHRRRISELAKRFESVYEEAGDGWALPRASSAWRDAGLPAEALRVSAHFKDFGGPLRRALLTTRGAAFADLDQWADALDCAREAIGISERQTYHAYMLLARIHAHNGDEAGLQSALERARGLGAPDAYTKRTIRGSVLSIGSPVIRQRVIHALLQIDSSLFEDLRDLAA